MRRFLIFIFVITNSLVFGQTKNVLFIGNSYTFGHDMPQIVVDLAGSAGDNMTYSMSAPAGYTLYWHSSNSTTLGLIHQGGWNFVVLQEYSLYPSELQPYVDTYVYPSAQSLDNEINTYSPGAETVFYMTWGRKDGDATRCPDNPDVCTYVGMDNLTRQRYMHMAQANHAIVSPVGAVWRYIRQNYPSIELYESDNSHPSDAGSYAAACSFYTAFFRKDPSALTYNYTLNATDASNIRNAAKMVVYDSLLTWHIGEYDPDTKPPTVPSGLSASNITTSGFTLSWDASSDNIGVTAYMVYRNGSLLSTVTGTSANITGLSPATTYSMTVKAKDAANNISNSSSPLNVTTSPVSVSLTISGVTAGNKVYNGTTAATLNTAGASLSGVISGDNVSLVTSGASGSFSTKSVGTGKSVTTSGFTLSGADAAKYSLIQPTATANITALGLTITGVSVNPKVYNGTTAATLNTSGASLSGIISGDNVSLITAGASGTFSNKSVGTGKTVATSGFALSGTDAGNYSLTQPSVTGNIIAAALTVSGVTASNKVYDGTTSATLNTGSASLTGVVSGDVVTLNSTGVTGVFENANTGIGKSVIVSGFTIGGPDVSNYTLSQPIPSANITGQTVTISGVTANNKVYNGTTAAILNTGGAALSGVISGDNVSLVTAGATGTFNNKNIGTGKTVNASGFALTGSDAAKYLLTQPSVTASITSASLTISGVTVSPKIYNGTTAASLNTSGAFLNGVFGSDDVTIISGGATGTFSNKNTGTGKAVAISGFLTGGADAGNYTLTQPSVTGNITAAGLTVTGVTANNKVYDRTTAATLNTASAVLSGIISGDAVTLSSSGATGVFENSNVGTSKIVYVSGLTIGGGDAGNYSLTQPTTTANITGFAITITGVTASNRVYNGTTAAALNTGSASLSGVLSGDVVNLVSAGATGSFANKNIGAGKPVTTSGFTLSGADAGKYILTQPAATASITAAGLTITGVTVNTKIYDGNTAATLNTGAAVLSGVFSGDIVTIASMGTSGIFSNKNAGTGKSVTTSGFALGGTGAGNYTLTQPVLTGTITAAGLVVMGVTASNKIYDGTNSATINTSSATLEGVLSGDDVSLESTGVTGNFYSKYAGTGKTVTTSGFTLSGPDAANYALTEPPAAIANILPAGLTITGVTANTRAYNGTTAATMNIAGANLVGVLGNDNVTIDAAAATGVYANKNAGSGKSLTTAGFALGGTDADNYTLMEPSGTGNITAAGLTISGITAGNKVYDGTTAASLNVGSAALVGIYAPDIVSLVSTGVTGAFNNKNAGVSKPVIVTGFAISGGDAGNYTLAQPSLTASITIKTLTLTANDLSKAYKTVLSFAGNEFTAAGIIAGDPLPSVTLSSPGAIETAHAGKYAITISGGTIPNYNVIYVNGTLTVGKDSVIATADNKSKKYADANPKLTISYTGFAKGEDVSVLDSPPVPATTALESSDAGDYQIILSASTDDNYDIILVNGTLKIAKAELTATVEDQTRVYGIANPQFSVGYSGFVAGQDKSVIDVFPAAIADADEQSDVGEYDINLSGGSDNNYSFKYVNGKLTITKADQIINFNALPSNLRVTQQYDLNASASSQLPVSFEISDPEIVSLNGDMLTILNEGSVTITARQEGDGNWNQAADVSQSTETLPTFDHISSLFTPNSDGMNDFWYIPRLDDYGKTQVTVYNRYGQIVYKSDSYKNDWDGTWNGNPLPSAAYYYIIKSSEKGFIKGVVNIVR